MNTIIPVYIVFFRWTYCSISVIVVYFCLPSEFFFLFTICTFSVFSHAPVPYPRHIQIFCLLSGGGTRRPMFRYFFPQEAGASPVHIYRCSFFSLEECCSGSPCQYAIFFSNRSTSDTRSFLSLSLFLGVSFDYSLFFLIS